MLSAAVATHWKNYKSAGRYFGRVFEANPTGGSADVALLGLATSLRNQGKKVFAFALFEQYILRHPENRTILHYLALDAHELGMDKKARAFYSRLLENSNVEDRIIFQAVQVFDAPGYEKKRSTLWLEYLIRHPDYLPFRHKLTQYYIDRGDYDKALSQLEYLSDNNTNNEEYLLEAGTVCQRDLKRPDKALRFYERYLQKHPENVEIRQKITNIQNILANDFLSIVENGGSRQLWRDLDEITTNPLGIYLQIAGILERNGQVEELIDVLEIIYKHSAPNDSIALKIANQYYRKRQYRKALNYLGEVAGEKSKTKSYFLLKGDSEQQLGLEKEALSSFEHGVTLDPQDSVIRVKCLELSGKIGNVEKLKSLFAEGLKQSSAKVPADFVISYLDLLSYNFLFNEYEKTDYWARKYFANQPEIITRFDIHKASSLRREGKTRRAEQMLRQLLNQNFFIEDILFQLTENAVIDKNVIAAENWYQALLKNTNQVDSEFTFDPEGCKLLLLKVDILKAEGKYGTAQDLIDSYETALVKIKTSQELKLLGAQLEKQRCLLSFYEGKFLESYRQSVELLDNGSFDPELFVIVSILERKLKNIDKEIDHHNRINIAGNPVLTRLLAIVPQEIEYQEYADAVKNLSTVLKKYPSSVVGNTLWAELMMTRGHGDSAYEYLSQLILQFPEEPYYQKKRIEVESRRGRYKEGLALMEIKERESEGVDMLAAKLKSNDDIEEVLTLARLLWGDKQQEKSLKIYKQLLVSTCIRGTEGKI